MMFYDTFPQAMIKSSIMRGVWVGYLPEKLQFVL